MEIVELIDIIESIIISVWGTNWRYNYEQSKRSDEHAMKVYFHEHGRRSFYCATALTASENAERFCEMAALLVVFLVKLLFCKKSVKINNKV